ncbi:MAG: ATP-binding cassette domain-containing protein [Thermoplasmatales archaeon]|nr:ATP-binding cassette domain-containing protein [Thermoplasmatales archaeon]
MREQAFRKKYGKLTAVDELSFEVEEGEIFGFLGPNGAGKTTTIKMPTCQILPTSGKAKIFDYDTMKDRDKIKKIIGILPQEGKLNELLTAEQNIYFYGMLYEMSRAEIKERAKELLSLMELENRRKDLVKNFSGGMKQRLNFILSIIHSPKIVFLDEPTLGLDPQAKSGNNR